MVETYNHRQTGVKDFQSLAKNAVSIIITTITRNNQSNRDFNKKKKKNRKKKVQ